MTGTPTADRRRSIGRWAALLASPSLLAGLILLALAGCSGNKTDSNCPAVLFAQDLGTVSRYTGERREPQNLQFRAEMRDIGGDCQIRRSSVDLRTNFSIVGERGSNDHSGPNGAPIQQVDLPYFVAILDQSGAIIWKQEFATRLDFGDDRRAGTMEQTDLHIPLRKDDLASNYRVLIGFQLTEADVEWNRRDREALDPRPPAPPPIAPRPPQVTPAPLPPVAKPAPPPVRRPPARRQSPRIAPRPSEPQDQSAAPAREQTTAPLPRTPAPLPYLESAPSSAPATPAKPYDGPLVPGYIGNRPAPAPASQ